MQERQRIKESKEEEKKKNATPDQQPSTQEGTEDKPVETDGKKKREPREPREKKEKRE
jgi:hypothetical protein